MLRILKGGRTYVGHIANIGAHMDEGCVRLNVGVPGLQCDVIDPSVMSQDGFGLWMDDVAINQ